MEEEKKLKINVRDQVAGGEYCNLAIINHAPDEFVVDFIFVPPSNPNAEVRSRIILSPGHAKRFFQALASNIEKYEGRFGPIDTHAQAIASPEGEIN